MRYRISPAIVAAGARVGLTPEAIEEAVKLSAPFSHPHAPKFTRRFEEYVFAVDKATGLVTDVSTMLRTVASKAPARGEKPVRDVELLIASRDSLASVLRLLPSQLTEEGQAVKEDAEWTLRSLVSRLD